ncbi:MAG: efflux RND transporter permease subunit [Pseudomonadota bacterium]
MPTESAGLKDLLFRNTHLLVLSILVVVLAGASALGNLPRIEDPRITTRNALIITEFPGASAERVEALVTKPLEDELREVEAIKDITSTSRANISVLSVELIDQVDKTTNQQAFSRIRDKLSEAEILLPPGAGKPDFDDERGASAFAMLIGLSADSANTADVGMLSRLAEELADRLRNLAGAERVSVYGATQEEIAVTLSRGELAAQGLSSAQLASLISAADPKSSAGALRSGDRDVFIEVGGELDSINRISNLVLRQGDAGRQLRLGDIASVERQYREPPDSFGYVDGRRTVFVAVAAAESVRIDRWQLAADEILTAFASTLDDGIRIDEVFRQSEYTQERLSSLSTNLLLGAAVVMLVVLLGLGWRAAMIVGLALPLSASATLFGFTFVGQQIHQMTIFGMIIAIGLLIDNAIVVTDEIKKRLLDGEDRRHAVANTVSHLFAPLFASTLTTILGFMPIFLLPGNTGDFVGPIAVAVVLALAASFVISLTIIAALAGRLLPVRTTASTSTWWQDGIRIERLNQLGERLLRKAFDRPLAAIAATLLLPVAGFILSGTLSLQFFPPADRDQFEVQVWMPDQSSLANTRSVALGIERVIREQEGVKQLSWLIGGSHPQIYYNRIMKQDSNAAYAHAMVQADSADRANRLVEYLQPELERRFPGAQIIAAPFAQGPPVDAPVGFRVAGPSVETLNELGIEIRRIMSQVPGISYSRASVSSRAKLTFDTDQAEAHRVGLTLDAIAAQLQGDLEGFAGGTLREDLESLPVRIRYDGDVRGSVADIASMPLTLNGSGDWIPASALGELRLEPENASITRRNGVRVNVIDAWVRPGVLPIEAANRVMEKLDESGFVLPPGYSLQLEGDSDAQQDAVGLLGTFLPVLLMLMVTTLVLSFRSTGAAVLIGSVAALSAGLGMLSLWLSGYNLGFNPLIGTAGLIGVAINGAIVVLAALRADDDASRGSTDAIVAVTMREARHVIATTATTIGGFLPLLVFSSGEFWPPLAVVIAGGVGFSITLSLVFTPAAFKLMTARRQRSLPWRAAVPASLVIFLGGCAVGPQYIADTQAIDSAWLETVEESQADIPSDWWTYFDDPLIASYVAQALDSNTDIGLAEANLAQARALRRQSGALLLPQLGARAGVLGSRLSEESPNVAASGGLAPIEDELYEAGFDASWELDLFGVNRSQVASADASTLGGELRLQDVRLMVAAEVVRTIVELRGSQRRLQITRANEELQSQTLDLVTSRQRSGLSPELDTLNALAQLESTRSRIPALEADVRAATLSLATLSNADPAAVDTDFATVRTIPRSSLPVAPGLRGDVLRRRPDVRSAEQLVIAATADVRVATSNFFPRVVLSASYGWQALTGSALGNAATDTWSVSSLLTQPLFTGGRLRGQSDAARARLLAAEQNYRAAVLRAIEDSEGSLNRYRRSIESASHSEIASEASAEAADIAARLYASGLRDFLSVLDAERRKLEAEDTLVVQRTRESLNLVSVYKSLGAI